MRPTYLSLLLSLLLSLVGAPLAGQAPAPDASLGAATAGQAAWDCRNAAPYGWVRADLPLPLLRVAAAHEQAHVAQMLAWGTCGAFQHAVRLLPGLRYDMEAAAYCAGAREAVAAELAPDLARAILDQAFGLAAPIYPWRVGYWQAVVSIRRACGLAPV